jgi:hypothetical protein
MDPYAFGISGKETVNAVDEVKSHNVHNNRGA